MGEEDSVGEDSVGEDSMGEDRWCIPAANGVGLVGDEGG